MLVLSLRRSGKPSHENMHLNSCSLRGPPRFFFFLTLTMAEGREQPTEAIYIFLQIKQEEAQKSVQVTTLLLLLGSVIMSIPLLLGNQHFPSHTHPAKCP